MDSASRPFVFASLREPLFLTVPMAWSRLRDAKALATALPRRLPVLVARDAVPDMYALLRELAASQAFDAVHADQTARVQYALAAVLTNQWQERRPVYVW